MMGRALCGWEIVKKSLRIYHYGNYSHKVKRGTFLEDISCLRTFHVQNMPLKIKEGEVSTVPEGIKIWKNSFVYLWGVYFNSFYLCSIWVISWVVFVLLQRNTMTTIHVGKKGGYLAYTSMSLCSIQGIQDKNSNRSGNYRQEILQRPWRVATYWMTLHS